MTEPMEDDEDFYGTDDVAPAQPSELLTSAQSQQTIPSNPTETTAGDVSKSENQHGPPPAPTGAHEGVDQNTVHDLPSSSNSVPLQHSSLLSQSSAQHVAMTADPDASQVTGSIAAADQFIGKSDSISANADADAAQTSIQSPFAHPDATTASEVIIAEPSSIPLIAQIQEETSSTTDAAVDHGIEHRATVADSAMGGTADIQPVNTDHTFPVSVTNTSFTVEVAPNHHASDQQNDVRQAIVDAVDARANNTSGATHEIATEKTLPTPPENDITKAVQPIIEEAEAALAGLQGGAQEAVAQGDQPVHLDGPEFEADSSPYESSSDDSSDSSSDDDSDEDYPLMDAREQARLLMEEGGSDDEGGKRGGGGPVRTQNEQIDEIVEMPEIDVTDDMKIEELGNISIIVDNVALIKAKTSGEYQVLETSSLLCRQDRKVIGVVSETIGRVEEPMYIVRFTNPSTLTDFGLEVGSTVYYVPSHCKFLFTKALHVKGSDASNLHDEEVGENEMDFSDDEAEQAYKSSIKRAKRDRKEANRPPGNDVSRGASARPLPGRPQGTNFDSGPMELSYDDDGGDDLYTPLARPANLVDLMRQGVPSEEQNQPARLTNFDRRGGDSSRGRGNRDRGGRDRGGGRGRGRGDHGGRGRGRGYNNQAPSPPFHQQSNYQSHGQYGSQWPLAPTGQNPPPVYAAPSTAAHIGQQTPNPYPVPPPPHLLQPQGLPFPAFSTQGHAHFQNPLATGAMSGGFAMPQWPAQPQWPQQPGAQSANQSGQPPQAGTYTNPTFYGADNGANNGGYQQGQYQNQP